ncbi:Methyltransferase-like protein 2 [Armadillidium nasatum]|uniref:Methyltransferase-like protein 2 n=1 Tax=Armadillidium nasatum TaxID=96803 RepID=A0A5N5TL63_9CRUS|nr:Methyltransferase-like protein 2 [Armadillidium nasatum]
MDEPNLIKLIMNNQRPQDNVEWDEEQECQAKEKVFQNSDILLSESEIKDLDEKASIKWDEFYSIHQNRFFKDRHWLFTEFSELESTSKKSRGK